ncbi:MAG: hypothetical protein Phog2KO_50120 [Phototrophicaceae bacterium]
MTLRILRLIIVTSCLLYLSTGWTLAQETQSPEPPDGETIILNIEETGLEGRLALFSWALPIVLAAGLSEVLGQSYVLFANRVKPTRFIITLLINILIFVAGFFTSVLSVWLLARYVFGYDQTFYRVLPSVAYSYRPLIFGFLSAIPYFGIGVINVLYFITYVLLAQALIFFGFQPWEAILCTGLSLIFVFILRSTIGRPIVWLGQRLRNLVAGTNFENSVEAALKYQGQYFVNEDIS